MHWLKKNCLVTALCLLFPLCALSADEDGIFTITIQGPETNQASTVNQTRRNATPRRRQTVATQTPASQQRATANVQRNTPPRTVQRVQNLPNATPNQANTATSNNQTTNATTNAPVNYRTYAIKSGDTIWSIASSFIPEDKSVNEFQIIASIYRNNPNAFANSNVNNLLKTTIRVPDSAEIAREDEKVGGRLLKQGSIVMPPLKARENAAQRAVNTSNQYVSAEKRPDSTDNVATQLKGKDLNRNDVSGDEDIPSYTAMEAKVKELQEKKEQEELNRVIPEDGKKQDQVKQDSLDKLEFANGANDIDGTKQKSVTEQVKNPPVIVQTVNGHQQALDVDTIRIMLDGNKTALEEKTRAIEVQMAEVMDRVKKTSAATAKTAADSVATLANQYDHIIANIQQDIIEIKGSLTKLSQDNERIREMVLANDEKLEDMMLQISNYTVNASDSGVDLNRPIMFILFGTGLLSLVLLIIFFIFKKQNRDRAYTIGDDFDVEDSSSENMLLTDENSVFEFDAPLDDDNDEVEESSEPTENSNAIDAPSGNVNIPNDNADGAKADENTQDTQEDNAQKAWDEAANTEATDDNKNSKDVMDDWSQALSEQQNAEQSTVDVDSSSDDLSAWDEALKEQTGDKTDDSPISDENDLSAWDEALKEQSGEGSDDGSKDESEQIEETEQTDETLDSSSDNSDDSVEVSADLASLDEILKSHGSEEKDNNFSEDRIIPNETENLDNLFSDGKSKSDNSRAHANVKPSENMTEADAIAAAMANAMNAHSLDNTMSPDLSNVHDELEDVADNTQDTVSEDDDTDIIANTDSDEQIAKTDDLTEKSDAQIDELNEALANEASQDKSADVTDNLESSEDNITDNTQSDISDASDAVEDSNVDSEDLSDEEKSLLDSLNKADTTDKSVIPSDEEAAKIAESEVLTNAQHDVHNGVGSNVDTVLDDDLDLESLLDESEKTDSESLDNISQSDENTTISSDDVLTDEVQDDLSAVEQTENTADETLADDEQTDIDEAIDNNDSLSANEEIADDTEILENTEIIENTENASVDNTDEATVSWSVPEGEDEIVENEMNHFQSEQNESLEDNSSVNADENSEDVSSQDIDESSDDEVTSTQDDLKELEARIGSAGSMYDPEADNDIMNMLSSADSSNSVSAESFNSDDITNMLQSASKASPDIDSRINEIKSSVSDDKISKENEQDNVLEQVFDRIGPISAIDDEPFDSVQTSSSKELTAKEHQYYVDELNLARLYFETGDTEEAIKIIDDVKEHGSDDLKQEALKIIESYGN